MSITKVNDAPRGIEKVKAINLEPSPLAPFEMRVREGAVATKLISNKLTEWSIQPQKTSVEREMHVFERDGYASNRKKDRGT